MATATETKPDRLAQAEAILAEFVQADDRGDRDASMEAHEKLQELRFTVNLGSFACMLVDGGKLLPETAIPRLASATAPEMARRGEAEALLAEYLVLQSRSGPREAGGVAAKI